jgi:MFS family permease
MSEGRLHRDRNLLIIFGVTLLAVMAVSSIAPALPAIVRDLGISKLQVGLLITAFTLPGVVLSPFLGVLADRFGRKRILVPSIFLFGVAGAACALTRDFNVLLVLRVFQGMGGAALGALNVTIIGDLYSGSRRTAAMGLNASVLSIGTASYPLIGGALASLGWYYPFYLPLVAIPMGLIVLTALRNPEPRNIEGFKDYLRGTWGYLKNLKVAALFAAGVLTFIILYGAILTYFSLLLDESFHVSAFTIGLVMSVMALTTAIVSSQLGRIVRWFSEATLIKAAFAIYALALALIPLMPSLWFLLIPMIIFGIAMGINMPSIQTLVAGLAPMEYRAAFMSINATMLRLGQTVGPPLVGLFYVYGGSDAAFYAVAGMALMVPVTAILVSKRPRWRRLLR